jgi:hypothetical protein
MINMTASNTPRNKSNNNAPVMSVTSSKAGISLLISESGGLKGLITAAMPKATPTLNIFEPIALPTASSGLPFSAEMADEKISGADVPNATIVKPIMRGETPIFRANADAPKTNLSAPQINPINPRTIMTASRNIYYEFLMLLFDSRLEGSLQSFASNNLLNCPIDVNCAASIVRVQSIFRSLYP